MIILSSYLLDDSNNARIEQAAAGFGDIFIPAPATREDRTTLVERRIAEADIFFGGRLTEEQFSAAERLRWIHVPWAGVNSLFAVEAIRRSTLLITNSSGVMSDAVADQVMGYILAMSRDLPRQIRAQSRSEWLEYQTESPRRRILRGLTLGIVGYGAIGAGVAERGRAFGMRIIATRRDASSRPPGVDAIYPSAGLHRLLEESDIVVLTAPLNEETRGMIGRRELERMKPDAFLINIARGPLVRQEELIEALGKGVIAGAALDVFEAEPLPADSPLWGMENVIVTPHSAGGYRGFWNATVDLFLDNYRRYHDGKPLRNRVEPERGY